MDLGRKVKTLAGPWPAWGDGSVQIAVERAGGRRVTPPFADTFDPNHTHRPIERKRDHIANTHRAAGGRHALAVEPHEPGRRERSGIAPGAHHARMPEPFIDALAVGTLALETPGTGAQDGSLLLCSSCCLSAASLANGEFGSGCLSRPPERLPNGFA
jgi:hypothetical protein